MLQEEYLYSRRCIHPPPGIPRIVNLQGLWLQNEEEDDEFNGFSDVEITRLGYRVDLIRGGHARVEDEAKISSRRTDWDDIIAER